MKKNRNVILLVLSVSILLLGFQNCSQSKFTFSKVEENSSLSEPIDPIETIVSYNHKTSFEVTESKNSNVDILFVIDNSGSMAEEQAKIAQVFSGFIAQVAHMNWRIAITTTDSNGSLNVLETLPSVRYYIDTNTPNVNELFMSKIQVGLRGSGTELGLTSVNSFLTKKSADYQSFMRADATFVVINVTDSEETSSLTAEQFLQNAKAQLPKDKKFVSHSSVVLPGDAACKLINKNENKYAQKYYDVTKATGGVAASICDENYGSQFQMIADSTIGKIAQLSLECAPVDKDGDSKLDVLITSSTGEILSPSSYEISDSKIVFTPALENVGQYTATYSCAE